MKKMNLKRLLRNAALLALLSGCLFSLGSPVSPTPVRAGFTPCSVCYDDFDFAANRCYERCGENETCYNNCIRGPEARFFYCLSTCTPGQ